MDHKTFLYVGNFMKSVSFNSWPCSEEDMQMVPASSQVGHVNINQSLTRCFSSVAPPWSWAGNRGSKPRRFLSPYHFVAVAFMGVNWTAIQCSLACISLSHVLSTQFCILMLPYEYLSTPEMCLDLLMNRVYKWTCF